MLDLLRSLDRSLFLHINSLAGKSEAADRFVLLITHNYLFKGLFFMALFWGLWFATDRYGSDTREKLIAVLVAAIAAILLGRSLAVLGPFRPRPIHATGLAFNQPLGQHPAILAGWSSMPSDNAMLHFAVAVGFGLVSRAVGAIALAYAAVVISLPRLYLGLHYPSDIVVGALIGGAASLIIVPPLARLLVRRGSMARLAPYRYLVYPALFLVTFQVATMFDSLRQAGQELLLVAQRALG